MNKKQSFSSKTSWAGTILYLIITAAHVWYLHGFLPVAVIIFLSFIGGSLLYLGLKKLVSSVFDSPIKVPSIIAGLFVFGLGALTLIPGWPDSWLLKTPIGWSVLEERSKLLDKAMYNDNISLVRKIAWAGLGDPSPRDSFGHPLLYDAKNPEMLRILLDSGLDPDARDEDTTTLLMRTHDEDIASVLLTGGADPNARDENGLTPLMHVRNANLELIKVLAENNADVNAYDDQGRTVADWLGDSPGINSLLATYTGGGVRRSTDLDFLSHARLDWLEQKDLESGSILKPSAITVNPDPMTSGDLADVQIRLSNETNTKRVIKVAAKLNSEALFVGTSHDGKITNPYQPQLVQEIGWPLLALPARSSGVLKMTIVARNGWDFGDLSIDVRARNVLTYSDEDEIFLSLTQQRSETAHTGQFFASWLIALAIPLLPLTLFILWRRLGGKHPVTRMAGRLLAGIASCLLFVVVYSEITEIVRTYTEYDQTEATILDRRYYLESTTTSTGSGRSRRSSTIISRVSIVAARYATSKGEVITTGSPGAYNFRELELGAVVPCWYDSENPGKFVFTRGISFFGIIGLGMLSVCGLGLAWVAFRRRKTNSG